MNELLANFKAIVYSFCPPLVRRNLDRIDASLLGSRLVYGALWSLIGSIIPRSLGLVASIMVARMLGKEGFGELGIIQGTIGMFGAFPGFGLGITATKFIAEFRQTDSARAGRILKLLLVASAITGGIATFLLVALAPWLAEHVLAAPRLTNLLRIGAVMLLLGALNGAQTGALAGLESFKKIAWVGILSGVLTFSSMVGGAYLWALKGAILGLVASLGLNCLLNQAALKAEFQKAGLSFRLNDYVKELGILWEFSLPATLSGILVAPITWACSAMLVNQPNGYAEMGIFNAANQWRTAILFLPGTVGAIVLPVLSSLQGLNDRERYNKVLKYSVILNGIIALFLAIGVAAFSDQIMAVYGKGFESGRIVLIVLGFSAVLMAANNVVGQAIASAGKMWHGFTLNGLWAITLLGFSRMLISSHGAEGMAWSFVIAYAFHSLWQTWYVIRVVSVR